MKTLTKNQRKCANCGAVINYSKHDIQAGRVPDNPLCPKCKRKEIKKSFKSESGFGIGDLRNSDDKKTKKSE